LFLGILTLITALSISAVAIYYSVAGLVAIFAAAAVPIIIMGGVLEVGKLVTAVWLHKYWDRATWWLKSYLGAAVIILMFITSMGIFGFLSKAHIEQTAAAGEGVAQIEQIDAEIARQQAIVVRAEQAIEKTQTSGTGADQNIQAQIDREQERIDTAYDRVQPAIDATNERIETDKQFYLDQLPKIDERLEQLAIATNINTENEEAVKRLQALVGARPDGAYGGGTARAVKAYKESLEAERADIFNKVEELKSTAQEEIARLRSRAESEIDDSNTLIARLRGQLGQTTGEDIDTIIAEQSAKIKQANTELDTLTEEKFTLEAEYRKLEAEVGPIKYIAEFIYGDQADKNLLEEAVRWVIIVIIVVFDPLAVLLLIASQYTFNWSREGKDYVTTEEEDESDDDGPGPEDPNPNGPTDGPDRESEAGVPVEQDQDPQQTQKEIEDWDEATQKETEGLVDDFYNEEAPVSKEDQWYEENDERMDIIGQNGNDGLHYNEVDQLKEQIASTYTTVEKKELESSEESNKTSIQEKAEKLEDYDRDADWVDAKRQWKKENPEQNIKDWKHAYLTGTIDELPWAENVRPKPDLTQVIEPDGYVQNSEQNESSVWQKIHNQNNK